MERLNMFIPNKVELEKNSLYLRQVSKMPIEDLSETFFPAPFEKYISICVDNSFNFWNEVVELIVHPLSQLGIGIVILTRSNEDVAHNYAKVVRCEKLRQYKSLINRAEVHVSGVDWSEVLCNYNHILLQDKPLKYNYRSEYTSIIDNDIQAVDKLSQSILDSIHVLYKIIINTKFIGNNYGDSIIELVPDVSLEQAARYIDCARFIAVRLDLYERYDIILSLLEVKIPTYVYIDKPIPKSIIKRLGDCVKINIIDLKNFTNQDIEDMADSGVPLQINSLESDEGKIAQIRNEFFDWEINFVKSKKNLDFLKKESIIKTSRYILASSGLYVSTAHFRKGFDCQRKEGGIVGELIDDEEFVKEIEYFYIYERD